MKAKIEWYQEVLTLEPGSKVFFPLAQLLAEAGNAGEAVTVLRQGLARHPEYIEARFLLVRLLQESGDRAQCAAELSEITDIFARYPDFWEVWSESSPTDDVACALSFLSGVFRSPGLSLRAVFAAGMRELSKAEPAPRVAAPRDQQPAEAPAGRSVAAPAPEQTRLTSGLRALGDALDSSLAPPVPSQAEFGEPSVRTRSMAEVLAEQGDIQGAVDIYNEILLGAAPGDEADNLRERLAELQARLDLTAEPAAAPAGSDPAADDAEPAEPAMKPTDAGIEEAAAPSGDAAPAENPMKDMLEKLAQRLDARAQT